MTIQFTGTAIQVFIIGARSTLTDVQFTLDGAQVGRFTSSFPGNDHFVYNVAALSKDGIPDGDHTLQMQSVGTQDVLILFDYAVYTTNVDVVKTPETTPTSSNPVQEAPATSNSQNPVPQVSPGSSSVPTGSADPLRSPGSSSISTSPSSPSGSSVPISSGSLTANSSLSTSRGSGFASGSGTTIANPTGAAGQNPTASLQPTSSNSPSSALLANRKVNIGAIIGGVLGGLVLLLAIVIIAVRRSRRKRGPPSQIEQPREKHQPHIIPFRVSVVGGRNDTPRTRSPSPSPSSEKQRLAAKFGDSPALLPSTDQDPVSMQQQISSLRAEVEALRAREAASSSVLPSSTGTSQSRNTEIAMLREEVARLHANHSREHLLGLSTSSPPLNEDFVRELASLRAEMDQLRLQQDIPQYVELPSYSPRPAER